MPKYLRKDFTYEYSRRGYMLFYKGQSIGGGSILHSARGPVLLHIASQMAENKKHAETAIQNILVGNPGRIFKEAIERIDSTKKAGVNR